MKKLKKILVCVDHPEHDRMMLDYVRATARLAEADKIYLLNVTDAPPDDSSASNLGDRARVDKTVLEDLAQVHINRPWLPSYECHLIQGTPLIEILRFAWERQVDLLFISRHYGQSPYDDDDALLARRIARKSTCTVVVMPKEFQLRAQTIVVPIRDSECSENALNFACEVAVSTQAKIIALNVFSVHGGYSKVGMTLEDHTAELEKAAHNENNRLISRTKTLGAEILPRTVADFGAGAVAHITDSIIKDDADLVVVGARGRTGMAGVLLGKVTENLIKTSPVPVVAVKKKGETVGILRALTIIAGEEQILVPAKSGLRSLFIP